MSLKKIFPYLVAGYAITVGVFFCLSALIEGLLLDPEPPGSHFLFVLSAIFVGIGAYSFYLISRGKIKKAGKSITEVRQEAVEKMTDPALLAQIALEDDNSIVSNTAKERLKELDA